MKLPPLRYVDRIRFILGRARGRNVLHLGCVGDAPSLAIDRGVHLHLLLSEVAQSLVGVDIDVRGLGLLKERLPEGARNLLLMDVDQLNADRLSKRKFDLVLAGDLIEHLLAPAAMLEGSRQLLASDGTLVITTPNAFGLMTSLRLLRGRESVHPRHTCVFTFSTLTEMARRCGLEVVEWYTAFDRAPVDMLTRLKYAIGIPFFKLFPHWGGTLVAVARPRGTG